MRTKCSYFLFLECMIHQFFEYEKIKEAFDTVENEIQTAEDKTEVEIPIPDDTNTKLLKDVGLLVVFYILFVFIFMITGSVVFKYIIMTRFGMSTIAGRLQGFPTSLDYRYPGNFEYKKFFSGGEESLLQKKYLCDYFTYTDEDKKVFLPINFSYSPYYNNWLYRHNFSTGVPGCVYSLDADMKKSPGSGEINSAPLSNTFPINWFWPTFTTVFIGMNNIFTFIPEIYIIIIVLLLALYNTISFAYTAADKNIYPSGISIFLSIINCFFVLFQIPVSILSFSSLFWSFNLLFYYDVDDDGIKHRIINQPKLFRYDWMNFWAKFWLLVALYSCLGVWLFINFFMVVTQFLPFVMMVMIFICTFCRSYGNYKYNNEIRDLSFVNILTEVFPIYCSTNRYIIFFMLIAFVLMATAINPSIGGTAFACMFFGSFVFYKYINNMIKNILERLTPKTGNWAADNLDKTVDFEEDDQLKTSEIPVASAQPSAPPLPNAEGLTTLYDDTPDSERGKTDNDSSSQSQNQDNATDRPEIIAERAKEAEVKNSQDNSKMTPLDELPKA